MLRELTLISAYSALSVNDNLKIEADLSQYLGNVSNGYLADIGLGTRVHARSGACRPFVALGTGIERIEPGQGRAGATDQSQRSDWHTSAWRACAST